MKWPPSSARWPASFCPASVATSSSIRLPNRSRVRCSRSAVSEMRNGIQCRFLFAQFFQADEPIELGEVHHRLETNRGSVCFEVSERSLGGSRDRIGHYRWVRDDRESEVL